MSKTVKIILLVVLLLIGAFAADAFIFMNHMKSESARIKSIPGEELEKLCAAAIKAPANAALMNEFLKTRTSEAPGTQFDFPVAVVRRHHIWAYNITLPCKLTAKVKDPATSAQ